jgi:hypothetical protein
MLSSNLCKHANHKTFFFYLVKLNRLVIGENLSCVGYQTKATGNYMGWGLPEKMSF